MNRQNTRQNRLSKDEKPSVQRRSNRLSKDEQQQPSTSTGGYTRVTRRSVDAQPPKPSPQQSTSKAAKPKAVKRKLPVSDSDSSPERVIAPAPATTSKQ
jgi:hypothetical protein